MRITSSRAAGSASRPQIAAKIARNTRSSGYAPAWNSAIDHAPTSSTAHSPCRATCRVISAGSRAAASGAMRTKPWLTFPVYTLNDRAESQRFTLLSTGIRPTNTTASACGRHRRGEAATSCRTSNGGAPRNSATASTADARLQIQALSFQLLRIGPMQTRITACITSASARASRRNRVVTRPIPTSISATAAAMPRTGRNGTSKGTRSVSGRINQGNSSRKKCGVSF